METSGLRGLQVQRRGGVTRKNTCEVHSLKQSREMGQGWPSRIGSLIHQAEEIVPYSKGNGEPWEVLSRGLHLGKFNQPTTEGWVVRDGTA